MDNPGNLHRLSWATVVLRLVHERETMRHFSARCQAMRVFQRILLVALLTIAMIAAGVAWERFYVSPLVEQAERKPDPPDSSGDDLPTACLEELSTMGQPSSAANPRSNSSLAVAKATSGERSPTSGENVLGTAGSSNQVATHIQVEDDPSSPGSLARDATARPIQRAQSAEWVEPLTDPRRGQRSQPG